MLYKTQTKLNQTQNKVLCKTTPTPNSLRWSKLSWNLSTSSAIRSRALSSKRGTTSLSSGNSAVKKEKVRLQQSVTNNQTEESFSKSAEESVSHCYKHPTDQQSISFPLKPVYIRFETLLVPYNETIQSIFTFNRSFAFASFFISQPV